MKIAVIIIVATVAMCAEAVRFIFGAMSAEAFETLLLLIVAAGCAVVLAFKKREAPAGEEMPRPQVRPRAKAAAASE